MRKFIGEILIDMECCTQREVDDALKLQLDGDNRLIGEILVDQEFCTTVVGSEQVAQAVAVQMDCRYIDLEAFEIPHAVIHMVPHKTLLASIR